MWMWWWKEGGRRREKGRSGEGGRRRGAGNRGTQGQARKRLTTCSRTDLVVVAVLTVFSNTHKIQSAAAIPVFFS
jgi:hypothetical protein